MIKQLILLVHVLGLFIYQIMFTGDLTVTQNVPDSIVQGTEAIVRITIKKGDITGFAKVQQNFPTGFTVEPIETKESTFSFKDNKIKFIWMDLPAEDEFTISYKITPRETITGDFKLGGKFSFISESERKNIEIPALKFSVISKPLVAETEKAVEESAIEEPIEEILEETAVVKELVTEEPSSTDSVEIESVESESTIKIVTINCNRTIENVSDREYKVTIKVDKNGIEGFAKITDQIPAGFTASEIDSKDGVFSFKNNQVKMLWMVVPEGESYSVTYSLKADITTSNGLYDIKGYYSYLQNDITNKYNIEGAGFELNIEQIVTEEPVAEESVNKEVVSEAKVDGEELVEEELKTFVSDVEEAKADEPVVVNNTNTKITATPNPENGVSYKVQVGAGHKTVASNYFAVKFNLKDNVSTINHEGWIKYLVGSFIEYKSARDKRNLVRAKVERAFVTAYNSGKRITVQEALMISNQKWYK